MTDRPASGDVLGSTLDGRYAIQEMVGRGGMAVVYRAWDIELQRAVAIKILGTDPDPGAESHRRSKEARALASINHPALVTLFDAVIREDSAYLVMELVEGHTLRTEIASGPLPSMETAAIAHDLADGLHAVHSRGIIHRDIKPANILLAPSTIPTQRFRAKLSDFGIAHFVDTTRVTTPGQFLGTATYVSPEQARGYAPAAPSDLYALGLTLLEALTGTPAFVGSALEVVAARLARDPSIPSWLGAEWSALLTRMTDRDPARRPTAIEVAAAARAIPPGDHRPGDGSFASTGEFVFAPITVLAPQPASTTQPEPTLLVPVQDGQDDGDGPDVATHRPSSRRWLRPLVLGFIGAMVVAAALLLLPGIGTDTGTGPATPSTPSMLPTLPSPLDEDVRDLLDQVSP